MKRAVEYNSALIDGLMAEITPEEQERSDNRMLLATKIKDAMEKKGLKKSDLATLLDKKHSVITRWLSGTQNFTIDTLSDIQKVLDVQLLNITKEYSNEIIINFVAPTISSKQAETDLNVSTDPIINDYFYYAKA